MQKNHNQVLVENLDIKSIEALAGLLQYRALDITSVAKQADSFYLPFSKKAKTQPFAKKAPPKKVRWISEPINPLKEIQKRIRENILAQLRLPDYICGGVKGKSTSQNALIHQRSGVLVTIDIQDYFPSITRDQIYKIWSDIIGCSPDVSDVLMKLTTYRGHLPQGAPTSTSLANIFLSSIDEPIRAECARLGVTYSVWVDDISFSGPDARRLIPVAIGALKKAGLMISRRKLRVMRLGERKIVTGIILGSELSVPSEYRDRLRAGIHRLRTGQIPPNRLEDYLAQLKGGITYVRSINRHQGDKLLHDLEIAKKTLPLAQDRATHKRTQTKEQKHIRY